MQDDSAVVGRDEKFFALGVDACFVQRFKSCAQNVLEFEQNAVRRVVVEIGLDGDSVVKTTQFATRTSSSRLHYAMR